MKKFDPFFEGDPDAPDLVDSSGPRWSLAGDDRFYIWDYRKYPRVTSRLSYIGGEGLNMYHAKVAALRAAAPLVHAGLVDIDAGDPFWTDLATYVDDEAIRNLSTSEALIEACDWRSNMAEPTRYRDHKGRIGSVVHRAAHAWSLGERVLPNALPDYLLSLASVAGLWPEEVLERFAAYGKTPEQCAKKVADAAQPYFENWVAWAETFRPEFRSVGLEAMVVNRGEEYAGSMDCEAVFEKATWERSGGLAWHWPGEQTVCVVLDYKTSNHLAGTIRYQLAAYSRASFIGLVSDGSEHQLADHDGLVGLHIRPDEPVTMRVWAGREKIDAFYEQFCLLNGFARGLEGLPRANQSRAFTEKKEVKGERTCPIAIPGGM